MRAVLKTPTAAYSVAIALPVAMVVFVLAVWLPNLRLLFSVWTETSVSLADKIALSLSLIPSIATNFTPFSAMYTILIAVLAGINAALIVHLIKTRGVLGRGAVFGISGGLFAGTLGLGCAACGSIILTSLIGTVGGLSVLALLPLRGGELGIIGVGLLGYSTYLLAKQVNKPLVCEPADQTP